MTPYEAISRIIQASMDDDLVEAERILNEYADKKFEDKNNLYGDKLAEMKENYFKNKNEN